MAIKFPKADDVKLSNPPLEEVICQVRYPPILRIGKEDPVAFQELVRADFPNYEFEHGVRLEIPRPGAEGIITAKPTSRTYRFGSKDSAALLSLCVDFFAISTRKYPAWEEFSRLVFLAQEAFMSVYEPSFAARVGLRYINRLTPDNTGLSSLSEILHLVQPELTASSSSDVWESPTEYRSRLIVGDEKIRLTIQVAFDENESIFLVIDFDAFEEGQIEFSELRERINRYHDVVYRAFRWALLPDSLKCFSPET